MGCWNTTIRALDVSILWFLQIGQPLKARPGKSFRYLTAPLQPTAEHLDASSLLHSTAFHIFARPEDLEVHVKDLLARRMRSKVTEKPLLVWEPAPPYCKVTNRDAHLRACKQVDIISPNHLELVSLFEEESDSGRVFDRALIEDYANRFLHASLEGSQDGAKVVIRAGEHGCLALSKSDKGRWFAPFYESTSPRIVDPTGAGNSFLGALSMTLQRTSSLSEAVIHGSVAASFVLEQIGLPVLGSHQGAETWNGVEFAVRIEEYRLRLTRWHAT